MLANYSIARERALERDGTYVNGVATFVLQTALVSYDSDIISVWFF